MIQLDTNFIIHALRSGSDEDAKLRTWLQSGDEVGVSAMAWAEFLCGPLTAEDRASAEALFPNVELLGADDAAKGAELFNKTGRRARSLADCLIAAVAIRIGARIATRNLTDFEPFIAYGLRLI